MTQAVATKTCSVHPERSARVNAGGKDACWWCWVQALRESRQNERPDPPTLGVLTPPAVECAPPIQIARPIAKMRRNVEHAAVAVVERSGNFDSASTAFDEYHRARKRTVLPSVDIEDLIDTAWLERPDLTREAVARLVRRGLKG